jgi:hypothetical protein
LARLHGITCETSIASNNDLRSAKLLPPDRASALFAQTVSFV